MKKNSAEKTRAMDVSILKGVLENTNEAFVTINKDSTVLFYNKAAEDIFGYSYDEVIGKDLALMLGPGCREGHKHAVARFIETGKAKLIGHETEFIAMRKNGENFPASISFSMARIDDEIFFTGIVRDLTETKTLQENLIRSERLAALGQTVAEITHEIRNPLMLIGGFARQLLKKVPGEKEQEKLKIIADEIMRLENMLIEVKDLYTPWSLVIEKFDIQELLREVHLLASTIKKDRQIAVHLTSDGTGPVIEGDREKLKQVLLNIVKNGIEAMHEGGEMTLEMQQMEDSIEIIIKDEGPGIPKDVQKKIFDPYFTTKKDGTGLGLCVSKRIVEDHGGSSLSIESKEGEGTKVKIRLACRLPG
ncbi:MAG: PAS domain S-box protein [Desulfobulbaceae bacterium]|nr:PAS domain S-box protein [Desulfobulbaceae bacterium]